MGTSFQESPAQSFGAPADTYPDADAGSYGDGEKADAGEVTVTLPSASVSVSVTPPTPETPPAPATPPPPSFSFSTSALTVLNEASGPSRAVPAPTGILVAAFAPGAGGGGIGGHMLQVLSSRGKPSPNISALISQLLPWWSGLTAQPPTTPQQVAERVEWFTDPSLVALFGQAAGCAARTTGTQQIHLRHLVAAVLLGESIDQLVLTALGMTPDELPELLLDAVRTGAPNDDQSAWEALLTLPLAGGISLEFVDPRFRITRADDALRHGVWAGMFAAVMADAETPLPLSIGLFGAWGSGKSHFMGLLRSEIDALCGQPGYVGGVVHVRFNAWHYADSNLWASLGEEIFRTLAEAARPPQETPRTLHEQAAELQQEIDTERAHAERYQKEAGEARLQAEKHAAEIRTAQEKQPLTARQLAAAALKAKDVRDEVERACDRLRIPAEEQAEVLTEQLADTAREGIALRALLRQRTSWAAIAVCVVALAVALAGTLIPLVPAAWAARLRDGGALASAAALLSFGTAALRRVLNGLAMLRAAAAKAAKENERKAEEALGGIRSQLHVAQEAERAAAEQLTEATASIARHERELVGLMPGRQLYSFLAERAASGEYARQLGLVSIIRKDLERLVKRLEDQNTPGPWVLPANQASQSPRRIDRIVLYIDDLDRCQPRQVVEVLQAVHLLLALNLFVVVVGVDPNWLIRSLRDQYPGVLAGGRQARRAEEEADVAAHPTDYLEKIINIPFTLPAFGADAMADMAKRLLPRLADGSGAGTRDGPPAAALPDETAAAASAVAGAEDDGQLRAEPGSLVATAGQPGVAHTATRRLTTNETQFLARLGPFMRTPRDAKRLFNSYRMIRATRDLSSASAGAFLGGEYQAVALLLAMVSMDARLLGQVLDAPHRPGAPGVLEVPGGLAARPPEGVAWSAFTADLIPVTMPPVTPGTDAVWRNNVIGEIPASGIPAWERLSLATTMTSGHVTLRDLGAFQRWASAVRRFSYALLTGDTEA